MANQIEKLFNAGANGVGLATTDLPGIASFDKQDFLVTSGGMVQALTKWGIAHTLEYRNVNDVARMYTIIASFGKQLPKIGDVGLVLSDMQVADPMLPGTSSQIGTIVRLTAIQTDGNPTVYYGEVLGSIRGSNGEQGIQGVPGQDGAIQNLVQNISDGYGKVLQTFGATGKAVIGDAALIVTGGNESYPDGSIVIITGFDNINVKYSAPIGSIKGVRGTSYIVAVGNSYGPGNAELYWKSVDGSALSDVKVGDYVIAATSNEYVQRGDIYLINAAGPTLIAPQSSKQPVIPAAALQLGIYNLSDAVEQGGSIKFKYSSIGATVPFVGALGLCIDDNDATHFGRIYTIVTVDEATQTVTTDITGSSIIGPAMDIIMGTVSTVPNTAAGEAGTATAELIGINALTKKLNLGIPAGPIGPQGIQGPAGPAGPAGVANVTSKGEYQPDETYALNDLVYFPTDLTNESFGGSYICSVDSTVGTTPRSNPEIWGLFVAEGAPGPQGPVGPQGEQGQMGFSGPAGGIHCVATSGTWWSDSDLYEFTGNGNKMGLEPGNTAVILIAFDLPVGNLTVKNGDLIEAEYAGFTDTSIQVRNPVVITNISGKTGAIHGVGSVTNITADSQVVGSFVTNITPSLKIGDTATVLVNSSNTVGITKGDIITGTITYWSSGGWQMTEWTVLGNIRGPAGQPEVVTISTGADGKYPTQGTFTQADMTKLLDSTINMISRDNEIYTLMDNQHDAGYLIYSHIGHNSANNFMVKCITVTVNTRAWVLTEQPLSNNYITVTGVSFAANKTFTLTQEQALQLKNDATCAIYFAEDDVIFNSAGASQNRAFVSYKVDANSVDASILTFTVDSITTGGVTVAMIRSTYSANIVATDYVSFSDDWERIDLPTEGQCTIITTALSSATPVRSRVGYYYNNNPVVMSDLIDAYGQTITIIIANGNLKLSNTYRASTALQASIETVERENPPNTRYYIELKTDGTSNVNAYYSILSNNGGN